MEAFALLNDKVNLTSSFAKTMRFATESANKKLLLNAKLNFAARLHDVSEFSKALVILKEVSTDNSLSKSENLYILSLLIINSIKLDRTSDIDSYYKELQFMVSHNPTEGPEYWLATGMYLDLKKQCLRAGVAYQRLATGFKQGRDDEIYVEGIVQLGALYSKELKRDSADYYFRLAGLDFKKTINYHSSNRVYQKALTEHLKRFKQPESLLGELN